MTDFAVFSLQAGQGRIAIAPLPGRHGSMAKDVKKFQALQASLVVSLTTDSEMEQAGCMGLGDAVLAANMAHAAFPVEDFGVPRPEDEPIWQALSEKVQARLAQGETVVFHCFGGRGRSGMAALRCLVELGEEPSAAFVRLRQHHPEAVETDAQRLWASIL